MAVITGGQLCNYTLCNHWVGAGGRWLGLQPLPCLLGLQMWRGERGCPWPMGRGGPSGLTCAPPGRPRYLHMGEQVDGVDMRAEVGLLSRNVVVRGEMEAACYPYANHLCSFFSFDTFGGHIKVYSGLGMGRAPQEGRLGAPGPGGEAGSLWALEGEMGDPGALEAG